MTETTRPRLPPRAALYGGFGTLLELYDFMLYIFLAPVIGSLFFPHGDGLNELLATYGVFAAGYLMRPIGGYVIGGYADRRGRKAALTLSVALMSVPMLVIAVLPTHASIGAAAPIALILMRLVQGFSVGGEYGGAMVMLGETAPPGRRGYATNLARMTAGVGILLASLTVTVMHVVLSDAQVADWGWRIPFAAGAVVGLLALLTRRGMPETEAFDRAAADGRIARSPFRDIMRSGRRPLAVVVGLAAYHGISYYAVTGVVPSWLTDTAGATSEDALIATTLGAVLFMVGTPLAGAWADRAGRRPLMVLGAGAGAVAAYPLFLLLADGELWTSIVGVLALMAAVTVFAAASTPVMVEVFDTPQRVSGVSIGYGLGMVFGGLTPLVATLLIKVTGIDEAPGLLLAAASLLALLLLTRVPETRPVA